MRTIFILLATFVVFIILVAGCSFAIAMQQANQNTPPQITLPPDLPTLAPAPTEPIATEAAVEICASAMTPGAWNGQGQLHYTAGAAGVNVIDQQGLTQLALSVSCDGSVTGKAQGTNHTDINYPIFVNGTCDGTTVQDVSGSVIPGQAGDDRPRLQLTFTVSSGSVTCTMDSRLSNIPSGTQTYDLTGKSMRSTLVVESLSDTQASGTEWPDIIHEYQLEQFGPIVEQTGLQGNTESSWALSR